MKKHVVFIRLDFVIRMAVQEAVSVPGKQFAEEIV